jgi:hypothetical protein
MEDYSAVFRERLGVQAEVCARKTLEMLQKDLQGTHRLEPKDIYYLASAAEILLEVRDKYGKK